MLHQHEVTYAVTGRLGEDPFPRSVVAVYGVIAEALVAAMGRLGVVAEAARTVSVGRAPASCFGAPSSRELVARGRKLAGSAQLRRRGAFLQHGSILLDFDGPLLGEVLPASKGSPTPATLRKLVGGRVAREDVTSALAAAFAERFPMGLEQAADDPAESEETARLRFRKYLDAEWTLHGRVRVF